MFANSRWFTGRLTARLKLILKHKYERKPLITLPSASVRTYGLEGTVAHLGAGGRSLLHGRAAPTVAEEISREAYTPTSPLLVGPFDIAPICYFPSDSAPRPIWFACKHPRHTPSYYVPLAPLFAFSLLGYIPRVLPTLPQPIQPPASSNGLSLPRFAGSLCPPHQPLVHLNCQWPMQMAEIY